MSGQVWWAEQALVPEGLARGVTLRAEGPVGASRLTQVEAGTSAPEGAIRLPGVVLPGLANCHSHAFHRALRGRTHDGGGTFWTWRDLMYRVASRLDPDSYYALARAAYAEMALSGITAVGEFHYVHHAAGGGRYDDPNAMGQALMQAAVDAGVRITLLDTCYLSGGLSGEGHVPLSEEQARFGDGDAQAWGERVAQLRGADHALVGAAIHSVRAVPFEQMKVMAAGHAGATGSGVVHAHVSEQPAENEACTALYGRTPVELLAEAGVLDAGVRFSAVHATHLTQRDIGLLGEHGCCACFCPTTERDLADGIGPARALQEAGAVLSLGSDQHAVVDHFEEARALEMHERLSTNERGRFAPQALLDAATRHDTIGWDDAGSLAVGQRADLVAVRLDSVRTAGIDPAQVLLAATASDVDTVVTDGRLVVEGGRHASLDVPAELARAIHAVTA